MGKRPGGERSWWSSGSVPDDLPAWARRGLDEAPEELTPSPAAPSDTGRHRTTGRGGRRRAGAAGVGGAQRLKGWGLAAASVAAAAAAVPLAVSTLSHSGENTALPRVGTFPVVAPGELPGGPPAAPSRAPGGAAPGGYGDATALPPLQDPTAAPPIVPAQPPRRETVTPRALARDADDETTTRTSRPTTTTSADDDESTGATETPTTRGDDDDSSGGSSSGGGSGSSGGGGSSGGESDGGSGGGGSSGGGSGQSGGVVGGLVDTVGSTVNGVTGILR
ncbi:hypothetical protein ACR9E3_01870 [Actinomycetospora sp. C-140]